MRWSPRDARADVPSPLRRRDVGPGGLEGFRFVDGLPFFGREYTCTGYLDFVRCTYCHRALSDFSGRRFGGSWIPIEGKKKLSAGLDDESDSCGDWAVYE